MSKKKQNKQEISVPSLDMDVNALFADAHNNEEPFSCHVRKGDTEMSMEYEPNGSDSREHFL